MSQTSLTLTFDTSAVPRARTTLGVALAAAAITTSMVFSRQGDGLDKTIFAVGAGASLLLLALGAWACLTIAGSERGGDLASWPGAAGVLGTGVMVSVLLDDGKTSTYLSAGLVLVLGVAGYLATRSAPFVLTVLGGLAVLYIQAVQDLTDGSGMGSFYSGADDKSHFMLISSAIAAFVVVVTVGGWFLERTRVLTGVLVGIGGLVSLAGVMEVLMLARAFATGFGMESAPTPSSDDFGMSQQEMTDSGMSQADIDQMNSDMADAQHQFSSYSKVFRSNPYKNDIYVVLGICVLLAMFWMACSLTTGHVAFRLLVIADSVVMVPMVMMALVAKHATWWAAGLAFVGIAVLILAAYRSKPPASEPAPTTALT